MSSVFAYCTSCGGKYFGLQPERSIQMLGLCMASEIASSCHGHDGWATMICMSGKAIATSSSSIGFEFCRRKPPPQRIPEPIPEWPLWKTAGSLCSAITS